MNTEASFKAFGGISFDQRKRMLCVRILNGCHFDKLIWMIIFGNNSLKFIANSQGVETLSDGIIVRFGDLGHSAI